MRKSTTEERRSLYTGQRKSRKFPCGYNRHMESKEESEERRTSYIPLPEPYQSSANTS